jgi:hypothetical protein
MYDQTDFRCDRDTPRDADIDDHDLAHTTLARPNPQTGLDGMKSHSQAGFDHSSGEDPGGGVNSTWHIDADDAPVSGVHGVDRLLHSSMGDAFKAGAEQRVDDHHRSLDRLRGGGLAELDRLGARKALEVRTSVR